LKKIKKKNGELYLIEDSARHSFIAYGYALAISKCRTSIFLIALVIE